MPSPNPSAHPSVSFLFSEYKVSRSKGILWTTSKYFREIREWNWCHVKVTPVSNHVVPASKLENGSTWLLTSITSCFLWPWYHLRLVTETTRTATVNITATFFKAGKTIVIPICSSDHLLSEPGQIPIYCIRIATWCRTWHLWRIKWLNWGRVCNPICNDC